MKTRISKTRYASQVALLTSGVLLLSMQSAHAQSYTLTFLGQLSNANGSRRSQAYDINDSGMIVGYNNVPYPTGGSTTGAVYYQNGTITSVGTLPGGATSSLVAVNNSGVAVGSSDARGSLSGIATAVLYDTKTGTYTQIGPTNASRPNYSYANGINNAGVVVGNGRDTNTYTYKPFVYTTTGGMKFIPTLDGDTTGTSLVVGNAAGINDAGQIIGNSGTAATPGRRNAYFLNPNSAGGYTTTDLVALGRTQGLNLSNAADSVGAAISANYATGYFVYGETYSGTSINFRESFVYNISTNTLTNLGLYNGNSTYAFDINDTGISVGYANLNSNGANAERIAYVTQNGAITDLNTVTTNLAATFIQNGTSLSFTKLNEARGINNLGQITGWGVLSNGTTGAFLLTPTAAVASPEPGSLALLPLPFLMCLLIVHRKRQAERA